jgi:hypothetical protein
VVAVSSPEPLGDDRLVLTLTTGCVQSTARRAHRELAEALLAGRAAGPIAESHLALLAGFLAHTDFAGLRTAHPELAGATGASVRLVQEPGGEVRWEELARP